MYGWYTKKDNTHKCKDAQHNEYHLYILGQRLLHLNPMQPFLSSNVLV